MESNSTQASKSYVYVHFFIDASKGVIKTEKLYLDNLNIHVIDLKQRITKMLEKDNSLLFKIISISKTINSKSLLDSIKISNFFENKDDVFCLVEMNIQPVKTQIKQQEDVLKFKTLSNYSFYVANKQIVKVLVPLKLGKIEIPKENVKSTFTESSLEVKIYNVNGQNYLFGVPRLDAKIIPEKSEAIMKDGEIVIRLRKAKEDDHWSYLFKQKYVGETE